MDHELRHLISLVQAKRYDDVRQPLKDYLKAHPDSAYGWYMQSFAARTPAEKSDAIQHALKLAPENANIARRATTLESARSRSSGGARRLLLSGVFVLLVVLLIGVVLLQSRPQPAGSLPTLAVFGVTDNAAQALVLSSPTVIIEPTDTPAVSTVTPVSPTETASPSLTPLPASPIPASVTPAPVTPTQILTLPVFETVAQDATIEPNVILTRQISLPTAAPIIVVNTAAPSATQPSATPFTPVPSPTVLIAGIVPFGQKGNIGVGQVQLIQTSRPGSTAIQQMGGTVPPAPAGQDWVLVEVWMQCSIPDNCAASLGTPRLSAGSGTIYTMPSGVSLEPIFGADAYFSGQVWGFAAFLVPSNESGLSLILSQNNQNFAFALQ